jgi:hypothetical protein
MSLWLAPYLWLIRTVGKAFQGGHDEGMKVVRRETIQILETSDEDQVEAPLTKTDGDVVQTDTNTHSREGVGAPHH